MGAQALSCEAPRGSMESTRSQEKEHVIPSTARKIKRGEVIVGSSVVKKGYRLLAYSGSRRDLEVVSVTQDGQLKVKPLFGPGATRVISATNAQKNFVVTPPRVRPAW